MTKRELQKVLHSLSCIEGRLISIERKFDEKEDYSFEGDYDDLSLRDLISSSVSCLEQICERCCFEIFLLNRFEKED